MVSIHVTFHVLEFVFWEGLAGEKGNDPRRTGWSSEEMHGAWENYAQMRFTVVVVVVQWSGVKNPEPMLHACFFLASMWHALLYFLAWHRLRMLVADDCWSTSPWIRERCHAAGDQVPWRDSTWHLELEKNAERKTCFLLWFADPLNSFSYSLHIFSAEETAWNCNIN